MTELQILYIVYSTGAVIGIWIVMQLYLMSIRQRREHDEVWAWVEGDDDY